MVMITLRRQRAQGALPGPVPPGSPPDPRTHPRLGPLGTNQGAATPTSPQKAEKRTSGSAKLCAVMASPLRSAPRTATNQRAARHGPAASHWTRRAGKPRPFPTAPRYQWGGPGLNGGGPGLNGAPQPAPPAPQAGRHQWLGDSSSFMARSPTAATVVVVMVVVVVVVVVAVHPGPRGHLGSLRSSAMSHSATLSSAREPDWCVAASGVGT